MKNYPVKCYMCHDKKMRRTHFDVVFGALAFFLCKEHQKALEKWLNHMEK